MIESAYMLVKKWNETSSILVTCLTELVCIYCGGEIVPKYGNVIWGEDDGHHHKTLQIGSPVMVYLVHKDCDSYHELPYWQDLATTEVLYSKHIFNNLWHLTGRCSCH